MTLNTSIGDRPMHHKEDTLHLPVSVMPLSVLPMSVMPVAAIGTSRGTSAATSVSYTMLTAISAKNLFHTAIHKQVLA